jgi:hypothetical protein
MFNRKAVVILMCVAAIGLFYVGQAICQEAQEDRGDQQQQDRGRNQRDPGQMRQRMMDRMKDTLGATDEEWKALEPKVEKVMTLSMDARGGMMMGRGMMGRGRGGRDATSRPARESQTQPQPQSEVAKATQALTTVLDKSEAAPEEIKTALANLRDAKAKAKVELETAQKDLREVLSVRQEARLVMMGLLD